MRSAPISRIRVAARLANGFALDLAKLGSLGRDVIDAVLLAAISQANVAQITRSPELQRRYATLDAPPPDELRRPVSINALAASLRMPFETARRRIAALAAIDLIRITPRGVIVPQGPLNSPLYRRISEAHYQLVRELYRRLSAIGLLDDLVRVSAAFDVRSPPIRLVIRLSSDYVLRLVEPVTTNVGDIVSGLVMMDVIQANTEHLPDIEPEEIADSVLPDGMRRPVRVATLSQRLGMPPETVRRHLAWLVKSDRCERTAEGYLVPQRVLGRQPFNRYVLDNQANLQRLFQTLADYGVVAAWDLEDAALLGAA